MKILEKLKGKILLDCSRGTTSLPTINLKWCTEENGQELEQRAIGLWKYARTGILACLKNQVENHSKIDNSINNQKSKTSMSNFTKVWKEKRENML